MYYYLLAIAQFQVECFAVFQLSLIIPMQFLVSTEVCPYLGHNYCAQEDKQKKIKTPL